MENQTLNKESVSLKNRSEILKELTLDSNYYGEFGQQFLSNSDIRALLKDPKSFHKQSIKTVPMVIGGYFHTIICEPDKVDRFKIIDATNSHGKQNFKQRVNNLEKSIGDSKGTDLGF